VLGNDAESQLNDFVALCSRSDFSHREEILKGIHSGEYSLTNGSGRVVPVENQLGIFRRRSEHVGRSASKSSHAKQMVDDINAYVCELEKAGDDEIRFWNVSVNEMSSYAIFEGVKAGKILGCIFGIDRTKVSVDEWNKIWGHDNDRKG